MPNLIAHLNDRVLKSFKISFTILFVLINTLVIIINSFYINATIESQNESLSEMIEHLITYTDDETVITYLEHYGHTHAVYLDYETLSGDYTHITSTPPSEGNIVEIYDGETLYAYLTIDNAQSNLFTTNLLYLFVINVALVLLYITFIIIFSKKLRGSTNQIASDLDAVQTAMQTLGLTHRYYFEEFDEIAVAFKEALEKIENIQVLHHHEIQALAHDLKTPLTVINGLVDGLTKGRISPSQSLMVSIQEESEKMSTLINEIIKGGEEKRITSINISKLTEEVLATHRVLYKEKGVFLQHDLMPNIMVSGNAKDLKRVIDHILQNALRHTKPFSNVKVTLKQNTLIIEDEGEGMDKKTLNQVFEYSESEYGSGIGLKLVKNILERHAFEFNIDSALDQGTTIAIHFHS